MRKQRPIVGAIALTAALAIAGCSDTTSTASDASTDAGAAGEGAAAADATSDAVLSDEAAAVAAETASTEQTDAATTENQESHFDADDLDYDEGDVVEISLDGATATATSDDVTIDGSTVTITAEGTYSLSGTLSDGEVIVEIGDEEDVIVILDGVDITNSGGAAVAVMNADDAVVLLAAGTTNQLTDGAAYSFPDAETDEPNATLFSAADLTIAGDGELVVVGNYNDGIASKDGLAIESGTISVDAADDAIRGKDYVIVDGGTLSVNADGDGIKSDNEEEAERGYVQINGGTVDIVAGDDGIQAATDVIVVGGSVTIDAGSVSGTGRGLQGEVMVAVSGGTIDATSIDDAIHSNNEVMIDGGTITLASGDDGVHGDLLVTINGGALTVTDSFEGVEAEVIEINDGFIDITANDDGLNVASAEAAATTETAVEPGAAPGGDIGAEQTSDLPAAPPGRGGGAAPGGAGGDAGVGDYYIYINGGTTVITITENLDEQGDGIDANGHVEMTGGIVAVSGPTDTRNSAVDYSGGTFTMTGGTFIGTNVDGRNSEGIGEGSSQASMYLTTATTIGAGTVVHIESADGESLITFEPENEYSVIVFSSPDLVSGDSYDVYLGGSVAGDSVTNLYDASEYTAGDLAGTATAE